MPGASAAVIARLNQRFYALCIAHGITPPIGMAEQPESEPNMIAPPTDSSAPTKRPSTLTEFLERYPLPWRPYRIDSLSGAEWEIEAANGQLVPNHGGTFGLEEYAKVFAEMGNELGRAKDLLRRTRAMLHTAMLDTSEDLDSPVRARVLKRRIQEITAALADTAAPAAQQEGE